MIDLFIKVRILDIIDILIVAWLLYLLYINIKGTSAMSIFIGIFLIYMLWLIVRAFEMQLLGAILGQVVGVGVIAILIVFQQEVRKFLIVFGTKYFSSWQRTFQNILYTRTKPISEVKIKSIHKACVQMARLKTGALIAIRRKSNLVMYAETGDILNANTSSRLIESVFHKDSPLHDGALIIDNDLIYAARCVLPVSEQFNLPAHYGMRHRAALGMSENTDALVIIISEQTGRMSVADNGTISENVNAHELMVLLSKEFGNGEEFSME